MNRVQSQELVQSFQTGEISRRELLAAATAIFGSLAAAASLLAACAPAAGSPLVPVVDATQPPSPPGLTNKEGLISGVVEYGGSEGENRSFAAHTR